MPGQSGRLPGRIARSANNPASARHISKAARAAARNTSSAACKSGWRPVVARLPRYPWWNRSCARFDKSRLNQKDHTYEFIIQEPLGIGVGGCRECGGRLSWYRIEFAQCASQSRGRIGQRSAGDRQDHHYSPRGELRTLPADNFSYIDADRDFDPSTLEAVPTGTEVAGRKAGRVAVMDGQQTLLYIKTGNLAVKSRAYAQRLRHGLAATDSQPQRHDQQ